MMIKLGLGDLLLRENEIGIVQSINNTEWGLVYKIYWIWSLEGLAGHTSIPDSLICKSFMKRFKHIKAKR